MSGAWRKPCGYRAGLAPAAKLPKLTPGGQWIYFSSDRTGRNQIWRVRAKGGAAGQVTSDGG